MRSGKWPRAPRVGDRVRIKHDIALLRHRKNKNGRIVRINGAYIDVQPMWCTWVAECYEGEIELL